MRQEGGEGMGLVRGECRTEGGEGTCMRSMYEVLN